jgi:hypothetical protein
MPDISGIDLTPLLNLIRGAQAASSLPEPQPDLANGAYSNEQAQRWIVWRNAKIQAAQVPQNVKDQMIAGEDFGEGEPMPHADQYLFGTRDNPLIQEGPGGAPVGARDVPGSADRNRFWNADPNGEGPNIAPYNAPGVQEDRTQQIADITTARKSGLTDQGFIPTTAINLHHDIAPQVPEGAARPFAPGEAVQNPNGGWSSEISATIEHPTQPGKWALVPSLWLKDGKPYVVHNSDEAADLARASGLQWPAYDTSDAADAAADAREQKWQGMTTDQARGVAPLWTVNQPATPATLLQQQQREQPNTTRIQKLLQLLSPSTLAGDIVPLRPGNPVLSPGEISPGIVRRPGETGFQTKTPVLKPGNLYPDYMNTNEPPSGGGWLG